MEMAHRKTIINQEFHSAVLNVGNNFHITTAPIKARAALIITAVFSPKNPAAVPIQSAPKGRKPEKTRL